MDSLLLQATVLLGTALLTVPLAHRLGLGSVLGYLAGGLLVGPILGLDSEHLREFGEYGVVVMLFLVGLEVEPRALWDMRHKLLGLGGLQVVLTLGAFALCAVAMGEAWPAAVAIGMVLAMSSTAIVVQTLAEKGLMDTPGGRSAFAVLLTQDVAVIPMLAVLPLLATGVASEAPAEESLSLVRGLPAWTASLVTLGAVGAVILTGAFLTRPVFRWIGRSRLREIDTAMALFIVISITVLMQVVGLSPALGTFLAGVVLAGSEFRHEIRSDLDPFKGLLLGLFFISIGAGIDLDRLLGDVLPFLALTVGIIAIKAALLFGLALVFRLAPRDRWLFALSLAQGGEFGFVLLSYAIAVGVLSDAVAQTLLLAIALSMLATPLLFLALDRLLRQEPDDGIPAEPPDRHHPAIIAGMGRFGRLVERLLRSAGQEAVLLDSDMAVVDAMRQRGAKVYLADPTRSEVLVSAGIDQASVLVAALNDPDATTRLVALARKRRPDLRIIARAHDLPHAHALAHAGADEVLSEVFESSLRAGRHALEALGLDPEHAAEAEATFAHHGRLAQRELGELWRPDIPMEENEVYLARAQELRDDIAADLEDRLSTTPKARKRAGPRSAKPRTRG